MADATRPKRSQQQSKQSPPEPALAPVSAVRTSVPHDTDAEAAVLSAVLLSASALDEVRELVVADDFLLMQHRVVFEAILEVDAMGGTTDIVTLAERLRAKDKLQAIGGTAFLAQLSDATPSVANLLDHARIVRNLALLRRSTGTLRALLGDASKPETRGDVPAFLQRCEAEIFAAATRTTERVTSATVRELMASAVVELDPRRPQLEQRGISTGLQALDDMSLGLRPGELWYLAARPGMGKTALALGISTAVAGGSAGHAIVFSMEMSRDELRDRLVAARAGVPMRGLVERKLSAEHWDHALRSFVDLAALPMIVDDDETLTPAKLRSRVRRHASRLREKHPGKLALIVVDYVQLMDVEAHEKKTLRTPNEILTRISRGLKTLAREFGVTVLALSQLNRNSEGARPSLTELRGSGALEQDADKVLFIHRAPDDEEGSGGEAELILAKGRNSGTGKAVVTWEPWCVRFRERTQGGFDWRRFDDDPPASYE